MISFSGLSTGLDTNALVEQLLALELIPARQLETRKSNTGRRITVVNDLVAKLKALKSATAAIDTPAEIRSVAASSSDPTKVAVASSGAAQPGQFSLRVNSLAQTHTSATAVFASSDAGAAGAGILGIKVGSGAEVQISFSGADSLAAIAQRINDDVAGVQAQLIDTGSGFRISLTSDDSGAANALSFTEVGASLGLLAPESVLVAAQDASFTLNGIPMTRSSNTVSDAAPGLTFTLLDEHVVGDATTQVSVTRDPEGTKTKLQSMVDSFNALADVVNSQMSYGGVTRGGDTLFGDSTVRGLQRRLSDLAVTAYPHGDDTVSLGQLGIRLGRDGRLTIDPVALAAAVAKDPSAIEDLIAGPTGLAAAVNTMVDSYTRAGDGFLTAKTSAMSTEMTRFAGQIERIESRAAKTGEHLRTQFSALEALMSKFQSQQATLSTLF
jgi:flagellar hook-associated protein 2